MANWTNPKLDWMTNPKAPKAVDFNRIEENIEFLKGDIETKKGAVVDALSGIGLDVDIMDTYAQIAGKIAAADQGAKIITPGTVNQTIPKGFHSGDGYVKGDANLVAGNILSGKSIFGVAGSFTPYKISSGYGAKGTGSVPFAISGLGFTPIIAGILFPDKDWTGSGQSHGSILEIRYGSFINLRCYSRFSDYEFSAGTIIFQSNGFTTGSSWYAEYFNEVKWFAVGQ